MLKVNLNTKIKRNFHNISQFVHINVFETFFLYVVCKFNSFKIEVYGYAFLLNSLNLA